MWANGIDLLVHYKPSVAAASKDCIQWFIIFVAKVHKLGWQVKGQMRKWEEMRDGIKINEWRRLEGGRSGNMKNPPMLSIPHDILCSILPTLLCIPSPLQLTVLLQLFSLSSCSGLPLFLYPLLYSPLSLCSPLSDTLPSPSHLPLVCLI